MIHASAISTFPEGFNDHSRVSPSQVRQNDWETPSVPYPAEAALDSLPAPAAVEDIADIGKPAGDRRSCMVVERSCSAWRFVVATVEAVVRRREILRATRRWTRHRRR